MIKRTYFVKYELKPEYIDEEELLLATCFVVNYSLFSNPLNAQNNAEKYLCEKHGIDRHKYYTSAFNRV